VVYGIRPEHFTIADDGAEAEIVVVEPTGSETQVFAKLGGEEVVAVFRERHQFKPGERSGSNQIRRSSICSTR
jgi:multiple sugar transport system ATP-binding protein